MVCRYSFTGPAGNEITLEGIPALKAYLATGGLDFLLPDFRREEAEVSGPQLSPPRFYSQLQRSLASAKQDSAPAGDWKAIVSKLPGVKKDEVEWSGLNEYLTLRGKEKVTKAELDEFLSLNNVKIEEVTKGGVPQVDYSEIEELPVPSPLQVGLNDDDRLQQYKYAVKTVMDGRYLGYGNTEQDALSDAYSGYPEYWEEMNAPEAPKYAQWTLPGGENYREMLLTLPGKTGWLGENSETGEGKVFATKADAEAFAGENGEVLPWADENKGYQSSHWDEANILAHIRLNDRTDVNGDKVLFVEEIQSDWAQAGRKRGFDTAVPAPETAAKAEYDAYVATLKDRFIDWYDKEFADEISSQERRRQLAASQADNMSARQLARGIDDTDTFDRLSLASVQETGRNTAAEKASKTGVPAAPFISNTKDWVALAVKRVMLLAAQGDYDKVAFVNGKQSADRYSLAKQVNSIEHSDEGDGTLSINIDVKGGRVHSGTVDKSTGDFVKFKSAEFGGMALEDVVGKELAQKILNGEGERKTVNSRFNQGASKDWMVLSGEGLEVGGEGMKSFYDRIVPQVVNDVLKKLGGRTQPVAIKFDPNAELDMWVPEDGEGDGSRAPVETSEQTGFAVTPEMREKLKGDGLPLFSKRRAQTDTAEFQQWFGDSKVVDANGEPLMVWNGTTKLINEYEIVRPDWRPSRQGKPGRVGAFFTPSKPYARMFDGGSAAPVRAFYLSLQNPIDLTAGVDEQTAEELGLDDAVDRDDVWQLFDGDQGLELKNKLEELGYDGAVITEPPMPRASQRAKYGQPITYVALRPTQIKSATDNVGTFDATNPDIRYSNRRAFGPLTPEQEAALNKVGGIKVNATIRERLMDLKQSFQKSWQQGIFDQFAPLRQLSQDAYMKARLSKGSDGTLEALMLYGKPFINKDGIPDVNINDRGFAKTLASLKGEHDRFLWWVAAQRAGMLKMQGLENLFDYGDISALLDLNQGNFADGTQRAPVYAKALKELNEFNDAVLKVAVDSGLVDPKAQAMFKDMPYVPFYRVMEGGNMTGPKFSSGLVNQTAWKRLKGGTQQLNSDLLTNMLLNWSHLYTASANNRAAVASLQAAAQAQIAYEVPAGTKKSVKVMVGGDAYHYVIDDPYLMEAVTALEYVSPSFFKPFSMFKRWLTVAVTANPAFKIRNLIRDSLSAIGQSDLSANPLANVKQGIGATSKEGQTYASMLAGGGIIRFGSMIEGDRAHQARALVEREGGVLLDKKGWEKLSSQMMTVLHAYNELGDRMENVNRAALYEQLIKKGYSTAEANFMARDLMDFSMSGKWPVVRFLAQVVPFMNARLQGLYKLGRSAKENPARFGYTVGAVALASVALMLAYEDDEDWKKRPDWDRDSNWWFKIGGTAFRIPKPFEIGALGTLAERTWELFFNKEMTGKRYRERISNMIFDTFAMDPTPQIVKPLLDIYSNKAGFTGRPIETMGMQKLRPEERVSSSTSQVAKFLGQLGLPDPAQLAKGEYKALSPVQVDYLLRGYFGWIGTTAVSTIDYVLRPMTGQGERPDMRLKDVFLIGNFVESLPSGSSRYVDQMYQQANEIEQAYASWRDAQKRGDYAAAKDIFEEEKEKIVKYKSIEKVKDRVADINARVRQIQSSKSLSGETKRRMIDQLEQQKDVAARAFRVTP